MGMRGNLISYNIVDNNFPRFIETNFVKRNMFLYLEFQDSRVKYKYLQLQKTTIKTRSSQYSSYICC